MPLYTIFYIKFKKVFLFFLSLGALREILYLTGNILVICGVTLYVTLFFVVYYTSQRQVTPVTLVTPIFHRFLFFLILLLYRCNALLQTKRATRKPPSKTREPRYILDNSYTSATRARLFTRLSRMLTMSPVRPQT